MVHVVSKGDDQEQRRRFIAETARDFLAKHWPNVGPDMAGSAVEYACKLADALEKTDCAPWSRTLDAAIDLQDSHPAPYLEMKNDD